MKKKHWLKWIKNTIDIIRNNIFVFFLDKGYYTAEQIFKSHKMGITTHIFVPYSTSNTSDKAYNVSELKYNIIKN